jgi:starch synthase (maltosyl-transferring)
MKKEPVLIYNLFPLLYGKIENWYTPVKTAKYMGFNTIYLNPIFEIGLSGSIYSIKDFFVIDKKFSVGATNTKRKQELKSFIEFVHKNNMRIIIDIVLNHTAIDSPLIKKHPEWYYIKNGKVQHPGAYDAGKWVEWGDLAHINNQNSIDKKNLYEYWWKLIKFYLELGFDGFRADAAYQIPTELWKFIISRTKKENTNVLFIAETLGCTVDKTIAVAKSGFDYIFNSVKYWNYIDNWPLEQLTELLTSLKKVSSIGFPESHDTERLHSELNDDFNKLNAKILSLIFFSEGLMITSGFEYCYKKRLNVVTTTESDKENTGKDITGYIKHILEFKRKYKILNEDSLIIKIEPEQSGNVLVLLKISTDRTERCLFILNRNFSGYERVYFKNIFDIFRAQYVPYDISVDYPMEYIPKEFEYYLRPGQVKILYMKEN